MLRDAIPGLKEIIDGDPPKGSTILVMGEAGTLKSAFVFSVMSGHLLKNPGENATYLTLDEKRESHIRNMASIGIKNPESLLIADIASFRTDFQTNSEIPVDSEMYFDQVVHILLDNIDKKGKARHKNEDEVKTKPSCYALDSLNALLSMMQTSGFETSDKSKSANSHRNKVFALLSLLRENNAVNFIIFETTGEAYRPEFFLADGIIELGTIPYKGDMKRYIQIKKMKGMKHKLEKHLIDVTPKGLEVMGKNIP